jgi:hypothetical protein
MPIIRQLHRLLLIQDGILDIGQLAEASKPSLLSKTKVRETNRLGWVSVIRQLDRPSQIQDGIVNICQLA